MRKSNFVKKILKEKIEPIKVDNFLAAQFQQLINRNLGIPIKSFQL